MSILPVHSYSCAGQRIPFFVRWLILHVCVSVRLVCNWALVLVRMSHLMRSLGSSHIAINSDFVPLL